MVEPWVRAGAHPAQPRNRRAARPCRRGHLQPARLSPLRAGRRSGARQREFHGLAARREDDALRPNGEHVPVRLVDAVQPANNRLTVTNQWTFQVGAVEKRFDVVFVVNGLPLVIGEAKTPTRSAVTWFDGAFQINEIYEKQVPAMFVPGGNKGSPISRRVKKHRRSNRNPSCFLFSTP